MNNSVIISIAELKLFELRMLILQSLVNIDKLTIEQAVMVDAKGQVFEKLTKEIAALKQRSPENGNDTNS